MLNRQAMHKIVRVQYTARQEYVEKNKENIRQVMSDLKAINNPGLKYGTYLAPDGKTFMHFSQFQTEAAHKVLMELPSFIKFQTELKASGPETTPKSEDMELVGASYEIFG